MSEPARRFIAGPHALRIGGERVPAGDGRTFETIDPATGDAIAEVAYAGPEDVDRAVRAARAAFGEGPWRSLPSAERARHMDALAGLIEKHADELAELESLDNGKPVTYARNVDIPLTVAHFRYFAGWPTKIEGEPRSRHRRCSATRGRSPSASAGRSFPGTFR